MKKIIFVVFSLLLSSVCLADSMDASLDRIEDEWIPADKSTSSKKQKENYQRLYRKVSKLANSYPDRAEPKIVQACILLTIAEIEGPLSALNLVHQARDLLLTAIAIDPDARNGSAVFTLGILYYKVPGWPIGFGDNDKAEEMLLSSLSKNPEGIGNNYYYGEFLLKQDRTHEAEKYIKRAAQTSVSPNDPFKLIIKQKAFEALAELI